MELTQLKYFVRLAELLNFTEASKSLFITQSTLSISVKQLELEMGTRLFDRIGKKVYLTDDGEIFYQYASTAIQSLKEGMQEIQIGKQIYRGTLTVGVTYSTCEFLKACIVDYTEKYPNVRLIIKMYNTVDEVMNALIQNQLDLIITYRSDKLNPTIGVCELSNSPLHAIVCQDHPLAQKKNLTLADLTEYPFVTFLKGTYTRSTIDRFFSKNEQKLEPQIEVNDTNIILNLVHTGHWISILSPLSIQHKGPYVAIPIRGEQEYLSVCVMWVKGKSKQNLSQTLLHELT